MGKSQGKHTGQLLPWGHGHRGPQVAIYQAPGCTFPARPCFCFLADPGFIIPGNKKDIHQVFLRKCASHSSHEEVLRLQRGKRGGSTSQNFTKAGSKRHQLPHGLMQNIAGT